MRLRKCVNSSLTLGCFPSSFKSAVVTPVLKKSNLDPFDISNYRPISNLSFLSKLLERVVSSQLLDYLNSNSLLPTHQSAYRPLHSTESAVLKVLTDVASADKSSRARRDRRPLSVAEATSVRTFRTADSVL